jgi:catechol 2,3-dioxygenase-like lactoylglutathione lyase family enzyme
VSTGTAICRLARFSLTTANVNGLAAFYESAFGCKRLVTERLSGSDFERLMGVRGGALSVTLTLGREIIELLQFDQRGAPYPKEATASDLVFQHFAIVVQNMAQACQRLSMLEGWSAISRDGPQRLPESSGAVTAFKFRDPEGHPLEFLAFPNHRVPSIWRKEAGDTCLGIDHSAISVANTARSVAFYESLGFEVPARSMNQGPEQEKLDDVSGVRVEVTALAPLQPTPHLELLCYQPSANSQVPSLKNSEIATTRLELQISGVSDADDAPVIRHSVLDPDGHHLVVAPSSNHRPDDAGRVSS